METKKKERKVSLMVKLGGGTFFLAVFVAFVVISSSVILFSSYLEDDACRKAVFSLSSLDNLLEVKRNEARLTALHIASCSDIAARVEKGEGDDVFAKLQPLFANSGLDFLTVTDAEGKVLTRVHEPGKKGDSLGNQAVVRAVMEGRIISVIDKEGNSPLSARAIESI